MGFDHKSTDDRRVDGPDAGREIQDGSTLTPGRAYERRSGVDHRWAIFVRAGAADTALFELAVGSPPEPFAHAEMTVVGVAGSAA